MGANDGDGGARLRTRQKALSALVAEQRAVGEELTATAEHLQDRVRDVIARLRAAGFDAAYVGTFEGATPIVNMRRGSRRLH